MSGTLQVVVGERGRVVIPASIRESQHWSEGTKLVAVEAANGVLLTSREHLEELMRSQLAGRDLVAELLEERRRAAVADDAA